ncbi:TetR/AcrR family transcriptional regulator, partial [Spirochaetota bacterium]
HGFAATSIRRIASEANVNISMIGYYYGGKEGLYKAVIDSHLIRFSENFNQKIKQESNINKRIYIFAETLMNSLMESSSILRIIIRELIATNNDLTLLPNGLVYSFSRIFNSFFEGLEKNPKKISARVNTYDIFMILAPVYFYFITRPVVDDTILLSKKEKQKFRKRLMQYVYDNGIKILHTHN